MAKNSGISWTDHTFNIVWGCNEISPACDDCYAKQQAIRYGWDVWGTDKPRRTFGEKHWNEPLAWNRDALKDLGRPARVFCSSMADVFEVHPTVEQERLKLWPLIDRTPNLEWLLLTKRWEQLRHNEAELRRPNVMPGVTVENQTYDFRMVFPFVEWISAEPLLGPLDISRFTFIKWVVLGGESKNRADHEPREMKLEWAIDLIQQCKRAGIAVHFKQTGDVLARKLNLKQKSGKDPSEWPSELRVQEFPQWEVAR